MRGLIATALGKIHTDLMQRTRASAGNHHLNRKQRLSNPTDDFRASAHAPAMEI